MSQVYLAKHRGPTNWGDRKSNQHKPNQMKCWFLVRGENLSEQSREPTNSTHIWRPMRESNLGHIGGRPVLSPLRVNTAPCIIFIDEEKESESNA